MPRTTERKKQDAPGKMLMCPNNELKAPVKPFAETFSAETIIMETFFPGK